MIAGSVRTKQWDEPADPEDGTRILVCRYRPRGLPKDQETWDEWLADLGPSKSLHAAAYGKNGDPVMWDTYRAAYAREMRGQLAIDDLAARVKNGETITLLCSSACVRESRCHRSLLKGMIEKKDRNGRMISLLPLPPAREGEVRGSAVYGRESLPCPK